MPKLVCDICFGLVYGELVLRINTVDNFFFLTWGLQIYVKKKTEIWLKTERY